MAEDVPTILQQLESWGLSDTILPFILVFTIMFSVLKKTRIIADGNQQFSTLISLVMALMVVIPHVTGRYPPGRDVVVIINNALPQVSLVVIIIVAMLLVVGVFIPGVAFGGTGIGAIFGLLSMAVVVYIFGNAAGWWKVAGFFKFLNDSDTQALIIVIVVFALVIWFVTRDEGAGEKANKISEGFEALKSSFPRG